MEARISPERAVQAASPLRMLRILAARAALPRTSGACVAGNRHARNLN